MSLLFVCNCSRVVKILAEMNESKLDGYILTINKHANMNLTKTVERVLKGQIESVSTSKQSKLLVTIEKVN